MRKQLKRLAGLFVISMLSPSFIFVFVSKSFSQSSVQVSSFSHLNTISNSVGNKTLLLTSTVPIVSTEKHSILNALKAINTNYFFSSLRAICNLSFSLLF
jgi:hypothetical protein